MEGGTWWHLILALRAVGSMVHIRGRRSFYRWCRIFILTYFRTNYGECEYFGVYRRCVQFGWRLNFYLVIRRSFEGLPLACSFSGPKISIQLHASFEILGVTFGSHALDVVVLSFGNSDSATPYGAGFNWSEKFQLQLTAHRSPLVFGILRFIIAWTWCTLCIRWFASLRRGDELCGV